MGKAVILTALLIAAVASPAEARSPIEGRWQKGNMQIDIKPCGASLCGTVVKASAKQQARAQRGSGTELIGATLIENIEPDEWDRVLAVNLKGVFLAAKAALAVMKAKRYGRMVFTSSITGPRVTSPGHGHSSASKVGINGFIRPAALEFAIYGVTLNGVEPGNILTEGVKAHRSAEFIRMMEEAVPLGRLGTPRDIANAVAFLASDEASYITGTTIIVDGGQILPEGKDFRLNPS